MGGAKQSAGTGSEAAARRVVVAGDITMDWHLARVQKLAGSGSTGNAGNRTDVSVRPGGAALMTSLMTKVAATLTDDKTTVEVRPDPVPAETGGNRFHRSLAVWSQYPRERGDKKDRAWRVEEFLGLDPAQPAQAPATDQSAYPANADLVILDDADLGFRDRAGDWPAFLRLGDAATTDAATTDAVPQPWILLKMAHPIAEGKLWKQLLRLHARRLVVVMTLNDLG